MIDQARLQQHVEHFARRTQQEGGTDSWLAVHPDTEEFATSLGLDKPIVTDADLPKGDIQFVGRRDEGDEYRTIAKVSWLLTEDEKDNRLRARECPSCRGVLEWRPAMFFSRRVGTMAGLVCVPCKALWDDPDNSFIEAHGKAEAQDVDG